MPLSPSSRYAVLMLALAAGPALAQTSGSGSVLTGAAAYGDWHADAPGLTRKITPGDLPAPLATPTAANRAKTIPKPDDAELQVPEGFVVEPFATGLKGARVIRLAPNGDIFVAQSRPTGIITVMRAASGAAKPEKVETFAHGLTQPYGIAFYPPGPDPQWVYVGETAQVVRFPYRKGEMVASGKPEVVISDLPTGGHWTRDIAFSPDGKTLYVAVGSASNVAEDLPQKPDLAAWEKQHALGATWGKEEGRAAVLAFDPDGKHKRIYAAGIRNCSGLAVQPGTGTLYCATNERDLLGDNLPPDYLTSVKEGAFYGWPWYYIGDNEDPRHAGQRPDLKGKVTVPDVLFQPHSAPLGVAFNPGGNFPAAWTGDAFVALHGSWNRSVRSGYKIVRVPFKDGKPTGEYQDLVIGFPSGEQGVWGRPVDVAFLQDGSILFSDDEGGAVYRVSYKAK